MKKLNLVLLVAVTLFIASCKDATTAQWNSLGKHHIITLYAANGTPIHTWESTGNVNNEAQSDGWYFENVETGKLVEISGTMTIDVKPDNEQFILTKPKPIYQIPPDSTGGFDMKNENSNTVKDIYISR
jgi:hypothetical protein